MRSSRCLFGAVLSTLLFFGQASSLFAQVPDPPPPPGAQLPMPLRDAQPSRVVYSTATPSIPAVQKNKELIPGAMEVRFRDGSILKVKLKDKQIEFETPHGKLMVAAADVHRIDVGPRISVEDRKRIDTAIKDLAHADAKRRDAAAAELLSLEEKSYPPLVLQTKSDDLETVAKAEAVLEKLRSRVPAETLEICEVDVIHTAQSKICGRLKGDTLRIGTLAFGDRDMKFADVRGMHGQYSDSTKIVRLTPAEMQKRLVAACPKASEIRVSIGDNGNLKVEVLVEAEADAVQIMEKISALPEMEPYQNRRDIQIRFSMPNMQPAMGIGVGLR